jgi:hypothetical protein
MASTSSTAAITAVEAGAVDAAQAARLELRPLDDLFRLAGAAHLRGHHAAGPGLQWTHHRRVIRRGKANKAVEAGATGGAGGFLDLGDRQPGVFLVEPDRVPAALKAEHLDQLRRTQLAQGEDAYQFALRQGLLQADGHRGSSTSRKGFPGEEKKSLASRVGPEYTMPFNPPTASSARGWRSSFRRSIARSRLRSRPFLRFSMALHSFVSAVPPERSREGG